MVDQAIIDNISSELAGKGYGKSAEIERLLNGVRFKFDYAMFCQGFLEKVDFAILKYFDQTATLDTIRNTKSFVIESKSCKIAINNTNEAEFHIRWLMGGIFTSLVGIFDIIDSIPYYDYNLYAPDPPHRERIKKVAYQKQIASSRSINHYKSFLCSDYIPKSEFVIVVKEIRNRFVHTDYMILTDIVDDKYISMGYQKVVPQLELGFDFGGVAPAYNTSLSPLNKTYKEFCKNSIQLTENLFNSFMNNLLLDLRSRSSFPIYFQSF